MRNRKQKYKIIQQPQKYDMGDYEFQLDLFIKKASGVQGMVGIYTMGSIGAPGLSDLDIVCLVKDEFSPKDAKNLLIDDTFNKDIIFHPPVILPESLLSDLIFIVYTESLTWVKGKKVDFDNLIPEADSFYFLRLLYLIDFSMSRLVQYAIVFQNGLINKRKWLARMWSLTHSYNLLHSVQSDLNMEKLSKYVDGMTRFRKRWNIGMEILSDTDFMRLFFDSYELTKAVFIHSLTLKQSHVCHSTNYSHKEFKQGNKFYVASNTKNTIEVEMKKPYKKLGWHKSYLLSKCPKLYLEHLHGYVKPNWIDGVYPDKLVKVIKRRSEVCKQFDDFVNKTGLVSMGPYLGINVSAAAEKIRWYEKLLLY